MLRQKSKVACKSWGVETLNSSRVAVMLGDGCCEETSFQSLVEYLNT